MKNLLLVANWKSNKTTQEAKDWLESFGKNFTKRENVEVIICPSFTLLYFVKSYVQEHNLDIKLGAQDVSIFPEGAHTGEVNAKQIKELVDYVIIGHSERRKDFFESGDKVAKKITLVLGVGLKPIVCVSKMEELSFETREAVIAYEPLSAIGTGNPENPQVAQDAAKSINAQGFSKVIYGGSVSPENISSFTKMPDVGGVLVGGASLSAEKFLAVCNNA